MTKKKILLFFSCVAISFSTTAQNIKGYVADAQTKQPVQGATVVIENTQTACITDDSGYFSLNGSNIQSASLHIQALGYQSAHYSLKPVDTQEIFLTPKDNFLNTVVVTGTRTSRPLKNSPVLTKVISQQEIRQSGSATVLEALENLIPGVVFQPNAMGDNIQIQGLNNKYILVMIDGERLVNERTENINFSRLNTSDIQQIEIINGASSVLYGSNAMGAVINIITNKQDKKLSGSGNLRYSNYNTLYGDALLGFRVNKFSSKTSFNAKSSDGYIVQKENVTKRANPYSDYSLNQTFHYTFNDKLEAKVNGAYYRNEVWFLNKFQTRVDENLTFGAKLDYKITPDNHLTLSGHSDSYDGNIYYKRAGDSIVKANDARIDVFRAMDVWRINENIRLTSGAEYTYETAFSYNQFGENPKSEDSYHWSLFSSGEFKLWKSVEAVAGLRYTNHPEFGTHLAPALSLMYPLKSFRFRANVSNGFKTPTIKELYMNFPHKIGDDIPFWVIGNPDLRPEESWYKSISAEYIVSSTNLSLILYRNDINNKITTIQRYNNPLNRVEMLYSNVESARISGIDLSAQFRLSGCLFFKTGYAYSDAIDTETDKEIAGNSKHNATLSITFQEHLPLGNKSSYPFSLMLLGRYMSPYAYEEESSGGDVTQYRTDALYSLRAVYTQAFPVYKQVKGNFQLGADNILNRVNANVSISPGRTFFASLGITF